MKYDRNSDLRQKEMLKMLESAQEVEKERVSCRKVFVICCCKLNKTRNCDDHLLDNLVQGQVVIN